MSLAFQDLRDRLLPITLNQVLGLSCGVAGVRFATQWVDPSDYGAYGVFVSLSPLGMWVVHAGLMKGVSRLWLSSGDRPQLLRETACVGLKLLPWLFLVACGAVMLGGFRPVWLHWLLLALSTSFLSLASVAQTALQAQRSHWADFGAGVLGSLARTFLPLLLYAGVGASLLWLELGFCLHALFLAGLAWVLLLPFLRRAPRVSGAAVPQLGPEYRGLQFPLLAVAGWVSLSINRWLIGAFFGGAELGFFVLAGNMSLVVTGMLSVVVLQYQQPVLFSVVLEGTSSYERLARRVDWLVFVYLVCAGAGLLLLWFFAPALVGPLVHERYRASLGWVLPSGCFGVALAIAQFYQVLLLAGRREHACRVVDPVLAVLFCVGGLAAGFAGVTCFRWWLYLSPLLSLGLGRTLARRLLFAGRLVIQPNKDTLV